MPEAAGVETMRRLYEAFESRDTAALRELLEECTWHIPGENLISGPARGADEILARFARARELTDETLAFHVHDVLGDAQHVVGLDRATARRGDRSIDMNRVVIAHARDGKLTEVWIVPEDQYAFDEFWS